MFRNIKYYSILLLVLIVESCVFVIEKDEYTSKGELILTDSSNAMVALPDSNVIKIDSPAIRVLPFSGEQIDTRNVKPDDLLKYANTLIGVPYKYGSTNPAVGFDCSGFITHVFARFNIIVPRSSIAFTHVGKEIKVEASKPGDIILFTGTDSTEKFVGHMGIITSNNGGAVEFIHSTSGKKYGVTITPLNGYYKGRYVKTIRIFPQNEI